MDWTIIINTIAQYVLVPLVVALVLFYGKRLADQGWAYLKAHTTKTQYDLVSTLATKAVTYVEQVAKNKPNQDKLDMACKFLDLYLAERGIKGFSAETLLSFVESSVSQDLSHPSEFEGLLASAKPITALGLVPPIPMPSYPSTNTTVPPPMAVTTTN